MFRRFYLLMLAIAFVFAFSNAVEAKHAASCSNGSCSTQAVSVQPVQIITVPVAVPVSAGCSGSNGCIGNAGGCSGSRGVGCAGGVGGSGRHRLLHRTGNGLFGRHSQAATVAVVVTRCDSISQAPAPTPPVDAMPMKQ